MLHACFRQVIDSLYTDGSESLNHVTSYIFSPSSMIVLLDFIVHLAISRFVKKVLRAYEIDDGQLTDVELT